MNPLLLPSPLPYPHSTPEPVAYRDSGPEGTSSMGLNVDMRQWMGETVKGAARALGLHLGGV